MGFSMMVAWDELRMSSATPARHRVLPRSLGRPTYGVLLSQLLPVQTVRWFMQLANKLFDVTVEAADGKVPVWHKDVRFFALKAAGKPKAYFYLGAVSLTHRHV